MLSNPFKKALSVSISLSQCKLQPANAFQQKEFSFIFFFLMLSSFCAADRRTATHLAAASC